MSNMEEEAREFLTKIAWSVFFGIFWMIVNMTLGVYFELLIPLGKISIGNIIYYIFFLLSLVLLIRFYVRTWKKRYPHG